MATDLAGLLQAPEGGELPQVSVLQKSFLFVCDKLAGGAAPLGPALELVLGGRSHY